MDVKVHSSKQQNFKAGPRAEGGTGDEPLSESQSDSTAESADREGAQGKREW